MSDLPEELVKHKPVPDFDECFERVNTFYVSLLW
jgi:hypothetical protein